MTIMNVMTMTDDYYDPEDYDDYESLPQGRGQASLSDAGKFGQYLMTITIMMSMMTVTDDYNDDDSYDDYDEYESFPPGRGRASLSDEGKFGQYLARVCSERQR